jgi:hypothetical protein
LGWCSFDAMRVQAGLTLLVTAGDNPERLRSEAAFAMLCGAVPLPVSRVGHLRLQDSESGPEFCAAVRWVCPSQVTQAES